MTITEAQKIVDQWINTIGVKYFSPLTNTAILMEEVGEMARIMARMHGEQSFKIPQDAEKAQTKLSEEMADVLFVLICLANQNNINLSEALRESLDKKTKRDATRHRDNPKLK